MAVFSDLPFELRIKIFRLSLPGPRVLHIIQSNPQPPKKIKSRIIKFFKKELIDSGSSSEFTVNPASYGGTRHPTILSINRESRQEALRYLTRHLNVYWNLAIDSPYFEIHEYSDKRAMLMTHVFNAGLLTPFQNIALDNMVWGWPLNTGSMEFYHMHGRDFVGIIGPIFIMRNMPNLKNLVVTYTMHTLQADLTIPYQAWRLGSLTEEVALTPDLEDELKRCQVRESLLNRGFFERDPLAHTGFDSLRVSVPEGVKISLMGVHGREREVFPPGKALRPPPLPANYYDWFG